MNIRVMLIIFVIVSSIFPLKLSGADDKNIVDKKQTNNAPDGFRGIKWGTDIKDLQGMTYSHKIESEDFYERGGDKKAIGEAEILAIWYRFYRGKFSGVAIAFTKYDNFLKLRDILVSQYGRAEIKINENEEEYIWNWPKVLIDLSHEKSSQEYLKWIEDKSLELNTPAIKELTGYTKGLLVYTYLPYLRGEEIEIDRKVIDDL